MSKKPETPPTEPTETPPTETPPEPPKKGVPDPLFPPEAKPKRKPKEESEDDEDDLGLDGVLSAIDSLNEKVEKILNPPAPQAKKSDYRLFDDLFHEESK